MSLGFETVETANPRLASEVTIRKDDSQAEPQYIVSHAYKTFFKVGETEHDIIRLLDGERSPLDIRDELLKTRNVDVPIKSIKSFIGELESLGLTSREQAPGRQKTFMRMRIPLWLLKGLAHLNRPFFYYPLSAAGLISLGILASRSLALHDYLLSQVSVGWFAMLFVAYHLTSLFHEIGHGAAILHFKHDFDSVQIRFVASPFVLHYSTPIIVYRPGKPIGARERAMITGGGLYFDLLTMIVGACLLLGPEAPLLKASGLLLTFSTVIRIVISCDLLNPGTDISKLFSAWDRPGNTSPKVRKVRLLLGRPLWFIKSGMYLYILYIFLFAVFDGGKGLIFSPPTIP